MAYPQKNHILIINASFGKAYCAKRQEAEVERINYATSINLFHNLPIDNSKLFFYVRNNYTFQDILNLVKLD